MNAVLAFFKLIFVAIPFAVLLVACGGGGGGAVDSSNSSNGGGLSNGGGSSNITTYSVGGTVSGLSSGSLVLDNNGTDALTIGANTTSFTFTTPLAGGVAYAVTVNTQPSGLGCLITNGSGTIAQANITNIAVNCYTSWAGTKQMGGAVATTTSANGVTVDASGKVYVTGQTTGDLDVNTRTGDIDFFLTKYSYSGVMQYTRQSTAQPQTISLLINTNETIANSVATDTDGNVYVAGYTNGDLDRNTSATLSGITDFFLVKYNSAGVKQYTKQMGDSGNRTTAQAVAVDASGNVYVAGSTNGNLDGLPIPSYLTTDFFLVKYDNNGAKQYTKMLGGAASSSTIANSVTVDGNGDIYIAGSTNGNLDTNTLAGTQDFFVTKYNSAGTKQYTKQLGVAASATIGWSVAVDASGNVYVAGETTGNLDGQTRTGTKDFFVTKYNSSGVKQYTKQLGAAAGTTTVAYGVTVDASGNVYVAGYTTGNLDGNTRAGTEDYFLTKYSSTGTKQYTRQVGIAGKSTKSKSIAIDSAGNVYLAGETTGGLDTNATPSGKDFFVAKYNSAGVKQ